MSKHIYLIANWKMNPITYEGATLLLQSTNEGVKDNIKGEKVRVVVCPPYQFIHLLEKYRDSIYAGAQNCFFIESGAYTGEVSSKMLRSIGCSFVIIGHSERRAMGEDDVIINKKVISALDAGLSPIIAIGDKDKNENSIVDILKTQLNSALAGIGASRAKTLIIAYEPVWAIGTGEIPDSDDILMVRIFIKKELIKLYGNVGRSIPIIYGGSANSKNVLDLLEDTNMDGLLVGGASVKNNASDFIEMYNIIKKKLI